MPAPTWTYEYSYDLARDRVRVLIGDVDATDKLIYDEEIAHFISADGDDQDERADYLSASKAASAIALKLVRGVQSISAGGTSVVFDIANGRAKFFRDLSATLAKGPAGTSPRPFLGGASISDKESREADTDRVVPAFVRARHEPFERNERYGDWS